MEKLEVLFTAVGSIGSRHLRNLAALCAERGIELYADVWRNTDRKLPEDVAKHVRNEIRTTAELKDHYDVAFITSSTASHFNDISVLMPIADNMFIEKPIFEDATYDLKALFSDGEGVYYVAAPIRFSKYFAELEKAVSEHIVRSARIIFSSYMPNWQKGRDYRKSFRTRASHGGGVDIDSLHEIDYMTALFGFPIAVRRVAGKYSNLEMDACDLATYIFEYPDKVVEMHLDYFGRVPNRRTELFCDDDVVVIDFNEKTVTHQLEDETDSFAPDEMFYPSEMSYFLDLIEGKATSNLNTPARAYRNLGLAKGTIVG